MEDEIKSRIILILAVLCAILFIVTISSCGGSYRQKLSRDREMAMRLNLEEKVNELLQEKAGWEEKLKQKEQELEEGKTKYEAMKKALVQEQLVNQSLKDELQRVSNLEDALEAELKEGKTKSKK